MKPTLFLGLALQTPTLFGASPSETDAFRGFAHSSSRRFPPGEVQDVVLEHEPLNIVIPSLKGRLLPHQSARRSPSGCMDRKRSGAAIPVKDLINSRGLIIWGTQK